MAYAEKRGKYWRVRYRAPDGTWPSASRDDYGNRFAKKREAEEYGGALEADARRGTFINPRDGRRTTVGEWAEIWFESIDVSQYSESTYRGRLRSVVLPHWGDVPLADVTTVGVNAWEKQLRRRYADNSVSGHVGLLRVMMEDAVASKVIASNPVPTRKGQRRGRYKGKSKTDERVIASPRQVLLIARNGMEVRGRWLYALILTAAYTGMRIGEIAGLEKSRVLLDTRDGAGARILLAHQQQYLDGKPSLLPAKYGSERELIIPPFLTEILREQMESHKRGRVFTGVQGGNLLIERHFYSASWGPSVAGRAPVRASRGKRAKPGVRPVRGVAGLVPHGLRHSHKVWLDELDLPRVAVEARMGHELPGVEGTYSHTTLAMELRIAEALQSLWEASCKPVVDRREFGPVPAISPDGS